jgi:hypothetical protein
VKVDQWVAGRASKTVDWLVGLLAEWTVDDSAGQSADVMVVQTVEMRVVAMVDRMDGRLAD